jgi:hypothetical protein
MIAADLPARQVISQKACRRAHLQSRASPDAHVINPDDLGHLLEAAHVFIEARKEARAGLLAMGAARRSDATRWFH